MFNIQPDTYSFFKLLNCHLKFVTYSYRVDLGILTWLRLESLVCNAPLGMHFGNCLQSDSTAISTALHLSAHMSHKVSPLTILISLHCLSSLTVHGDQGACAENRHSELVVEVSLILHDFQYYSFQ